MLEDRRLPSTFHVTSTADDGSIGTLRRAVQQADAAASPSTIDFDLGNAPATITLLRGPLELSNTAEPTAIDGPGAGLLTVNGNRADSVFRIDRLVPASLSGLTIAGGSAGNHGGGVNNSGAVMLANCTISGNSAQYGGGLFNEGTATLTNCTISGNTAIFESAGIYNDGTLTLTGTTIQGNTSNELGGGLQNKGTATLTDCSIISNTTPDGGGGVYNTRTVMLTNCTISGNHGGQGAGLTNYGSATLTNCTISFNSAQRGGGGLSNSGNGLGNQTTLVLTACTVTGNTAPQGGGLYNHKGLVNQAVATLTDTIVAGNTAPGDVPSDIGGREATGVTGTFNLVGTGGSGGIQGDVQGNIVLTTLAGLGLAPLRDYGGPTQTIAFLPGSAAIGKGTAIAGITTDQRGIALDAPSPDIGAFQTQTAPLVVGAVTDNGASPGVLDLRAAIDLADVMGGARTITFDPAVFATAQTITLTAGQLKLSSTTGTIAIDGPGADLLSIDGNRADSVFQINSQVTASISGLTITGGSTRGVGGGVLNLGTATLDHCTISGNSAGYGGGVLSDGTLSLDHCTISGNSATIEGGGVWTSGPATITGCAISGNTSGDIGGGLNHRGGVLTMTGCTISGNVAQHFGGGVYNQATATVTGCTISGNTSENIGGGLVTGINGLSTLMACTISGNSAEKDGGGLENYSGTMLTNCTIAGNTAAESGGGVSNSGTATLTACTVSGNTAAESGGGFYNHDFLDNRGVATLTDTIVAGNLGNAGAPGDIGGQEVGRVTGSFDLIGPGGSGGIRGGTQGNIVLAGLAGLGPAPLGDYGGPTRTIALLPGSPALGTGTAINGVATDQRGEPLDVPVDIGAVQSQGFFLSLAPGTSPQSAPTGEAFANPLAVMVVARNPVEPVAGGVISFAVTPGDGGAGADLSAATAVIGADHTARVTAAANASEGTYVVTASTAGGLSVPRIILTNLATNLARLALTGLTPQSLTFGTATVTFTGTLANGARAPQGESLAVTFGGVTQQVVIGPGGAFSATFDTAGLTAAGSPYTVTFRYTSDGNFASLSTTRTLTVAQATPVVSAADAGGTFNNAAFPALATIAGVDGVSGPSLEGVAPSLTYFSGIFTDAAQLAGLTPLGGAPSQAGSYTVVARFPGSADYAAAQSAPITFTIGRGTATVALDATVGAAVFGQPVTFVAMVSAAGTPSGTVTFFDGTTPLGTVGLDGSGRATLTASNVSPGPHTITATYGGDSNLLAGASGSASFTIARGTATVALESTVGASVFGQPVSFLAMVSAAGTPGGTVTFFDGAIPLATVPLDGSGRAMLTASNLSPGPHTITATYGGNSNLLGGASGSALESVARAGTQLILVPHPVFRRRRLVALGLTAEIRPLAPSAGLPGGMVRFLVRRRTLGSVALRGGAATLSVQVGGVLKKALTIIYSGDGDFESSTATPPVLTRSALASLARAAGGLAQ
jgi:hypothetical protein